MGLLDIAQSTAASPTDLQDESHTYKILTENWFQSFPYGFRAIINGQEQELYLPINPQNLNITTYFATNFVPTLYKTVEEHSDVRYYSITIHGTTGFSPQYVSTSDVAQDTGPTVVQSIGRAGRADYGPSGSILGGIAGGFFANTLGKVDQTINQASNAINAALGQARPFSPGVFSYATGYLAFHNLYQFLLKHKAAAVAGQAVIKPSNSISKLLPGAAASLIPSGLGDGGDDTSDDEDESNSDNKTVQTPLYFMNYKDNNKYSCVVESFVLQRSAENPMLYNYVIQLKAYGLDEIGDDSLDNALADRLSQLGLTSGPSVLARIKGAVRGAKGAANSLGGAFKTLGT